MSKQKKTAGKTAKDKGYWRETTRKGERVLIDPDGRIYHGTAQEVRDAALAPWRRRALAESLRLALFLRNSDTIGADEFREMCGDRRRSNLMFGANDESASVRIPMGIFIKLCAGARLVGFDSIDDFFADLWDEEMRALADVAESETGKREIPLTRQERAALERIGA